MKNLRGRQLGSAYNLAGRTRDRAMAARKNQLRRSSGSDEDTRRVSPATAHLSRVRQSSGAGSHKAAIGRRPLCLGELHQPLR
jgi:hypothetical protein